MVQIPPWWLCTGTINVLNLQPHGRSYRCFTALAQPAEGRVGARCSKDEFLQQRDFFSRVWAIGHAAQVLQNENMCLSDNESRKRLVVTREKEALGAEYPGPGSCARAAALGLPALLHPSEPLQSHFRGIIGWQFLHAPFWNSSLLFWLA